MPLISRRYQTPDQKRLDRKDHCWSRREAGGFKCLLCGALTAGTPPPYPTPGDWRPDGYEPLTDAERQLVARCGGK